MSRSIYSSPITLIVMKIFPIIILLFFGMLQASIAHGVAETREINFSNRHKIIYKCKFSLPKVEDCTSDSYRGYIAKAYTEEYEDYRNLLEDLYYDNNCTWPDIVALLFSEKKPPFLQKELKCEQRTHEDLKKVGLEQEIPSRINKFETCVQMVEETADKVCAPLLRGERVSGRIVFVLKEIVRNTSAKVIEHSMELTRVMFEERLKRREILAMQEELHHRNDQLWQRLNHTMFNYFKEMQEFSFQFQPFVRCVERVKVMTMWIKEKSVLF